MMIRLRELPMTDLLGYAASCAVLVTFLMRSMASLRMVAILSNVLFAAFGYAEHIYPVLFLHALLLPINLWGLLAISQPGGCCVRNGTANDRHAAWRRVLDMKRANSG
jgi:hypothetical protein